MKAIGPPLRTIPRSKCRDSVATTRVAAAWGLGVPGNRRLWLIVEGRLYLFFTPASRAAFGDNPKDLIEAAERTWPAVEVTLSTEHDPERWEPVFGKRSCS